MNIPRFVLTGGPCAGKTTAQADMREWLLEREYYPIFVPEAATSLMRAGLNPLRPEFQPAVLQHVLSHEAMLENAAKSLLAEGKKPVLIADRGVCDQLAYTGLNGLQKLLNDHGLRFEQARDERYDGVIYMRSAANGAEEFYTAASNETRYESLQEAKMLDDRTMHAWVGTPHLIVIKNEPNESFSGKINRAVGALARLLGEPEPLEAERRFLVGNFALSQLPPHAVPCDIVQTYLVGVPGKTERVRARGQNNYWVYSHTVKEHVAAGVAIERERMLTRSEYDNFLIRRDRSRVDIHKTRHCFVYDGHYCELDVFHTGRRVGEVHLEIEVAGSDMHTPIALPPFLQIDREITHEDGYSNFDMSAPAVAA